MPKLLGNRHIPLHRTPNKSDLAPVSGSRIEHLLNPVDVRSKRSHHNLPACARNHLVNNRANFRLRTDKSRSVGIRRIAHEQIDALFTGTGKGTQIGQAVVNGELVDFEIASYEDIALLGANKNGKRIGNRVVDRDKLHVERANIFPVTLVDNHGVWRYFVLGKLGFNKGNRERRTDKRNIGAVFEQVRHSADMVLMPMGENNALNIIDMPDEVVEVGKNEVNSRVFFFREKHAAINNDNASLIFENITISSDFAEPAERNNAYSVICCGRECYFVAFVCLQNFIHLLILSCLREKRDAPTHRRVTFTLTLHPSLRASMASEAISRSP